MTEYCPTGKAYGLPDLTPLKVNRTVVYSRVSTDGQERDGTSLDTQERESLEHVRSNGWDVIGWIRYVASGHTLDRPGIEKLRGMLREGAVWKEVGRVLANPMDLSEVDRLERALAWGKALTIWCAPC